VSHKKPATPSRPQETPKEPIEETKVYQEVQPVETLKVERTKSEIKQCKSVTLIMSMTIPGTGKTTLKNKISNFALYNKKFSRKSPKLRQKY